MKKIVIPLFLVLSVLFLVPTTYSQNEGKDISVSPFVPDLDGKVATATNTSNTSSNYSQSLQESANFTVFPGFPVSSVYAVFSPKTGGIYCNMDNDPEMEIVFAASQNLHVVNLDGTPVAGWPKSYATNNEIPWAPSYGDIDGDGKGELVVGVGGTTAGNVYAYKQDGTVCAGFPVASERYTISPTLSDLNNDGKLEIIIGTRSGKIYVWKGDGSVLPGWPKQMDRYIAASCSIGDINNDGQKDIVAQSRNLIYVYDTAGNVLPGFPYSIIDSVNGSNSYSACVIADIDNNGTNEIIFGSHSSNAGQEGIVYVVKNDGTTYPGWPKFVAAWIYGAPSVYDVNNDGNLEIFIPEYGSSATPAFYIFGYTKDGVNLPNFPIGPLYGMANQVTIANLDDDPAYEIMVDQNIQFGDDGQYVAFNLDGTNVTGFPLSLSKNTSFQQPIFGDFDNNGIMDMAGFSFEFSTPKATKCYVYNTGLNYNSNRVINRMYMYGETHEGYFSNSNVPVELTSFTASTLNNNVYLKWTTASELNNKGFSVEKNAGNGFNEIAFVNGNGTSAGGFTYQFTDENIQEGLFSYRLKQVDYNGAYEYSDIIQVEISKPHTFSISQNFPNPFNPSTEISYSIAETGKVSIKVIDVLGNLVNELVNEIQYAGKHNVTFNGSDLSSGVYFCKIVSGNYSKTIKMNLLK